LTGAASISTWGAPTNADTWSAWKKLARWSTRASLPTFALISVTPRWLGKRCTFYLLERAYWVDTSILAADGKILIDLIETNKRNMREASLK
jgi:hypothetical protein